MRKLAYVSKITDLKPISGADRILEATVLGWSVVVKKTDGFKIGDSCIYIEIDTKVPPKKFFEFLEPRKYKIKTAKFKKCVSYGLVLPLNVLSDILEDGYEYKPEKGIIWSRNESYNIVDELDLTDMIGVQKYDKTDNIEKPKFIPNPKKSKIANKIAKYKWLIKKCWRYYFVKEDKKTRFPSHLVPKTDQKIIQSIPSVLRNYKGKTFQVEMKADGSSMTCLFDKKTFKVCSRNLVASKDSKYWQCAVKYDLKEKLSKYKHIALQMEVCGSSIHGNKYGIDGLEIFVFDAYDTKKRKYLNPDDFNKLIDELELPRVPVLFENFVLDHTIEELIKIVTRKSLKNPKAWEEGYVFKLKDHRMTFKVINPKHLLDKGE